MILKVYEISDKLLEQLKHFLSLFKFTFCNDKICKKNVIFNSEHFFIVYILLQKHFDPKLEIARTLPPGLTIEIIV